MGYFLGCPNFVLDPKLLKESTSTNDNNGTCQVMVEAAATSLMPKRPSEINIRSILALDTLISHCDISQYLPQPPYKSL